MNTNKVVKEKNKIKIMLIMMFYIIVSSILTFSFSVFIIQILFASITIPLMIKKDYKFAKMYLIIFIVSNLFMFLVYAANDFYYGVPYYIGGSDDLQFEKWGMAVYNLNIYNPAKVLESGIIGIFHNSPFYPVYIALLMKFSSIFSGYTTFLPRIINIYFLLWICMIVEYLLRKYGKLDNNKVYLTILLFGLTPNIQYINSHVFRDTLNLLQIILILYIFDKIVSNKKYLNKIPLIILLGILCFVTYYTRKNSLVFAGVLCILILGEKLKIKKRYYIGLMLLVFINSKLFEIIGVTDVIGNYSQLTLSNAGDGLSRYVFNEPLLPFGIILRSMYAFITPFPDFFNLFKEPSKVVFDIVMILIYLGVIIQILFIPFILKRIIKFDWLALSFLTLFLTVIGTTFTFRHLIFYYPFMVALAIDGYFMFNKNSRIKLLFMSTLIGIGLGLIYAILKLFS